ncbi:CPBP family intramembrane glutamic endopeptidase [Chryseobacterium lathyri]|uniref:CPBP family intramembrane glutamic endopeptidase n=1 Tax=Chryseobacterium lathyri TaxID=395933 RepID=UPI00277EDDAA|nr:type II CAAX endopeptidase family protein [Chryseobacterium lathyri]MDQ0065278.1 membrane protease YdiL (CAAX protease family) [Chryseobacterium lathyri]
MKFKNEKIKLKLKTLGVILLTTIGMLILFILIAGSSTYARNNISKWVGNIIVSLLPISVFFYVLIFNRKYNHLSGKAIGFYLHKFFKNIAIGITLAFVMMGVGILVASIVFGVQSEWVALKPNFGKTLFGIMATCVVVGFWEEFYFRGLVLNTLMKNNFGFHTSALISSILFSVVHWSSFDMEETSYFWYIGIVFFGYIFAIVYVYFKSIWVAVSLHFFWDVLAYTVLEDPENNKVGIMVIKDYALNAKYIDNALVLTLGVFLILALFIIKKHDGRIRSYVANLNPIEEKERKLRTL